MQNNNKTFKQLLVFALLGGAGTTGVWASTPYSTAIPPGPEEQSIGLDALYLSKDGARSGRYSWPVDKGDHYRLNLNLMYKDAAQDNRYSHFIIRGLNSDTQYFKARVGEQGNYSTAIEYHERPLYQNYGLTSPLRGSGLTLPNLAVGEQYSDKLTTWDIDQKRETVRISGQKVLNKQWRMNVLLNREDKAGRRLQGYGSWFNRIGFQMPAPINQRTDQAGVTLEYAGPKLQGRMGYNISEFKQMGDNYFLADDVSAIGSTRHLSLAPSSTYQQLTGSLGYSASDTTRISTELDLGRARQDDSFIHDPVYLAQLNALDTDALNAKMDTIRFGVRLTERLSPTTTVRVNYRLDDRNTRTSQHQDILSEFGNLRSTRPVDLRRQTMGLDGNTRVFGNSTLWLGVKHVDTARKYSSRSSTYETTGHGRLRTRFTPKLSTGLQVSYGERVGSTYDDTLTNNNEALRKYHQASVDRTRAKGTVTWNAMEQLALGFEASWREDDYRKSELGLQEDERIAGTITADYFPSQRLSGYLFATYEDGERTQAGRAEQLTHKMDTYTLGVGGKGKLTKDGRWSLGGDLMYITSDIDISARSGNDYPTLKSTLREAHIYGDWEPNDRTTLSLGYIVHRYKEADWALGYNSIRQGGSGDYWLMGAEEFDQTVHIIMGSVKHRF